MTWADGNVLKSGSVQTFAYIVSQTPSDYLVAGGSATANETNGTTAGSNVYAPTNTFWADVKYGGSAWFYMNIKSPSGTTNWGEGLIGSKTGIVGTGDISIGSSNSATYVTISGNVPINNFIGAQTAGSLVLFWKIHNKISAESVWAQPGSIVNLRYNYISCETPK